MYLEIIAGTFAEGRDYQAGQVVELADKVAQELIVARKAIPARKPAASDSSQDDVVPPTPRKTKRTT